MAGLGSSSAASMMARPPRIGGTDLQHIHKSPASSIKDKQIDILANDLRRSIERLDKVIGNRGSAINNGIFSLKNKVTILSKNSIPGTKSPSRKSELLKYGKRQAFAAEKPMVMRIEDQYQQVKVSHTGSFSNEQLIGSTSTKAKTISRLVSSSKTPNKKTSASHK